MCSCTRMQKNKTHITHTSTQRAARTIIFSSYCPPAPNGQRPNVAETGNAHECRVRTGQRAGCGQQCGAGQRPPNLFVFITTGAAPLHGSTPFRFFGCSHSVRSSGGSKFLSDDSPGDGGGSWGGKRGESAARALVRRARLAARRAVVGQWHPTCTREAQRKTWSTPHGCWPGRAGPGCVEHEARAASELDQ